MHSITQCNHWTGASSCNIAAESPSDAASELEQSQLLQVQGEGGMRSANCRCRTYASIGGSLAWVAESTACAALPPLRSGAA